MSQIDPDLRAEFIPSTTPKGTALSFGTATLSEGIVKLFRENGRSLSSSAASQDDGTMLAILAIPSYMTPADFLTYVAPAEEGLAHIRLVRFVTISAEYNS